MEISSHQSLQVRQVSVAVFVHLHHLNLHASHLSTGWVGTVGGLGDQTHLKSRIEISQGKLIRKNLMLICSTTIYFRKLAHGQWWRVTKYFYSCAVPKSYAPVLIQYSQRLLTI